jgi:hypothetical protein
MLRNLKQELEEKEKLAQTITTTREYDIIKIEIEMLVRFISGIEYEIAGLYNYADDHDKEIDGYFNDKDMTEHESDEVMIARFNEILGNVEE